MLDLSLAGLILRLETPWELKVNDHFRPFVTEGTPQLVGRFRSVESLGDWDRRLLYTGNCYRVHPGGIRGFFEAPRDLRTYALARPDYDRGCVDISYLEWGQPFVSPMDNAFFHLGFEGLLIRRGRICFHAACIRTELGGILFSGPSGIGKSTQARLWQDHRGAALINGDRPILQRSGEGFLAWGSPYAGSSKCYVNESVPITAMVFLSQAPENRIRRLKPNEAFRQIYSGLTMYSWDPEFTRLGCDLAIAMAQEIPCYSFGCRKDASAVDFLEHYLKEDGLCVT